MAFAYQAYKHFLKLPNFKGKHHLEARLRKALAPAIETLPGGIRMQLDPAEWLQISLIAGKNTEPVTSELIRQLLSEGDDFIDIGAHVGLLSLQAAKTVGPLGRVVSVDPQPYNCDRLLINAALNGFCNILVVPVAIGEYEHTVLLANQSPSDKARLTLDGPGVNDTTARFLTAVWPLGLLMDRAGLKGAKVMKVDVEGLELPILRGASEMLSQIENIIFESLPTAHGQLREIRSLLDGYGFNLSQVDGSPLCEKSSNIEFNIWASRKIAKD